MKKKWIRNYILSILMLFIGTSYATPTYTRFGPAGIVSYMQSPSDAGTALAQANYSLYKTYDFGATWSAVPFIATAGPITTGVSIGNISVNPSNENLLLAQGFGWNGAGGIYQSQNGGSSWIKTSLPDASNSWQYSGFGFDMNTPNIVYTSIRQVSINSNPDPVPPNGNSIYKSNDRGTTWSVFSQMGNNFSANNSIGNGSAIFSINGTVFAGNMKTTDGINWINLSNDAWINSLFIKSFYAPSASENIIFAATNGGVIYSFDGGVTWASSYLGGDQGNSIIRDKLNHSRYFATGMTGRLYESTDSGINWSVFAQLPTMIEYANLAINSSGDTLYVLDGAVGSGGFAVTIAAVPEIDTFSLMLGGIGLLGVMVRQRGIV